MTGRAVPRRPAGVGPCRDVRSHIAHAYPNADEYLDVPAESLHLRRKAAGHTSAESDYFLHEPAFLDHARDYFVHTARQPVTRELTVLDAAADPDDVAQAVEALVSFWAR
ncbi:hypothetical protein [Streptomyces bacillaris]|uniref:hypothetical protein n=1 Tax=Streptomyces bacillaris TaxID=68179 RepID=UPI00380903C5